MSDTQEHTQVIKFTATTGRHKGGEWNSVVLSSAYDQLERELAQAKGWRENYENAAKGWERKYADAMAAGDALAEALRPYTVTYNDEVDAMTAIAQWEALK